MERNNKDKEGGGDERAGLLLALSSSLRLSLSLCFRLFLCLTFLASLSISPHSFLVPSFPPTKEKILKDRRRVKR